MRKGLLALLLFSACALAEPNAYESDAQAYAIWLNKQVSEGRITGAQAAYMMGVKDAELRARSEAIERRRRNVEFWREVGAERKANPPPQSECTPSQIGPLGRVDCR